MSVQWFRDSFTGQCLRLVWNPSCLMYDEERRDALPAFSTSTGKSDEQNITRVDWYSENDEENPQNWSAIKKSFVLVVIGFYSFVVILGATVYTSCVDSFIQEYGVNHAEGSLGLALYVLGYGTGPLFFSPLSEVPRIGRNLPYAVSFFCFCILSIPTAISPNAIGFYFLRLLQGIFGSACLGTGGASIADVFSKAALPHAMTTWVACLFCAPAIGVLISGFAVPVLGWRFSMWEILIASGPVMVLLVLLPETSSATILHRRARRLERLETQKGHTYQTSADVAHEGITFYSVVQESLLIPAKITFLDPSMFFLNCYMSLVYGIYYSFFESFPIVYQDMYGFNLGQTGLAFLAIVIGTIISVIGYNIYIQRIFIPKVNRGGFQEPEDVLVPALFACFGPPIGLFLFGWAANPHVHWVVPTIGIVIYPACVFVLMQCIFIYIAGCYPKYAASVFAANDFSRSAFACGAVLFSRPLYENLGVGQGCSLLAGLAVGCVIGIYVLYTCGKRLRHKSSFESKW